MARSPSALLVFGLVAYAVVAAFIGEAWAFSDVLAAAIGGVALLSSERPDTLGLDRLPIDRRRRLGRVGLVGVGVGLVLVAALTLSGAVASTPLLGIAITGSIVAALLRLARSR